MQLALGRCAGDVPAAGPRLLAAISAPSTGRQARAPLKRARDLMHGGADIPTVPQTATLGEAIVEMTSRRFGITGVVDADGRIIGVLTDGDLRRAFQQGARLERPVAGLMTRNPHTTQPQNLAADLINRMQNFRITSIFVVDEASRPVGVLHLHDLLRDGVM
jgi:arabinose-5-phosphate isomerase